MTAGERHIRLKGAHNVRDLGGYLTPSGDPVPWRTFLRADALHDLDPEDVQTLLGLGLKTVIDLRSDAEIRHQPSAFADHGTVRYHHVSLFDGLAPFAEMYDEGFDLSVRYVAAIGACRPALLSVAQIIAQAEDGAILFNCTAGKDRTGIVAAMLLSLAGVAKEEIATDYGLTAELAAPLMQKLRLQAVARGLDEAQATVLLSSEPAAMLAFLEHMDATYGGFQSYLGSYSQDVSARLVGRR
ncbi:tyrosine-protein phosphatase [Tianweitania sediminis]|uniref:Tyrosine-protein phosphatase n=1 Tax=Tianweitania sediminis TaxID=1502156 RepID=A0A8J7UHU8_9HYPH|nr:tyrosine-protein phosphatase [Tianweitania sediminis]MBP0437085.1 tyrosine-protein phosphatase [Tianweitania sediminis]